MALNDGGRYAVQLGACLAADDARLEAFAIVHDELIAHNPRRLGPVRVSWYAAAAARDQLRIVGLEDHLETPGLLAWLEGHAGSELVIGMVEVPG